TAFNHNHPPDARRTKERPVYSGIIEKACQPHWIHQQPKADPGHRNQRRARSDAQSSKHWNGNCSLAIIDVEVSVVPRLAGPMLPLGPTPSPGTWTEQR